MMLKFIIRPILKAQRQDCVKKVTSIKGCSMIFCLMELYMLGTRMIQLVWFLLTVSLQTFAGGGTGIFSLVQHLQDVIFYDTLRDLVFDSVDSTYSLELSMNNVSYCPLKG